MKTNLIAFIAIFALIACDNVDEKVRINSDPWPPRSGDSYIQTLMPFEELMVEAIDSVFVENGVINTGLLFFGDKSFDTRTHSRQSGLSLVVGISTNPETSFYTGQRTWSSYDENGYLIPTSRLAFFNKTVEALGDTGCTFPDAISVFRFSTPIVLNPPITVNVTCGQDWDAAHPVGASLNDVFTCFFESPLRVVENGYKQPVGDDIYVRRGLTRFVHAIEGHKLSELDLTKVKAMGDVLILKFDAPPAQRGDYTFTVDVTRQDGVKFTQPVGAITIE